MFMFIHLHENTIFPVIAQWRLSSPQIVDSHGIVIGIVRRVFFYLMVKLHKGGPPYENNRKNIRGYRLQECNKAINLE